jgi:hypothetical protein
MIVLEFRELLYSRAWSNHMPANTPLEAEKYSVIENVACNIIGNVAYGRYRTDAMCS